MIVSKALNYMYIGLDWTKLALKTLLADKLSAILLIITLLINVLTWVASYFLNNIIATDLAVLHYNVVFGIDLVGDASQLYFTPFIALVILIVNILLAAFLKNKRDKLISAMLLSIALVVNIFCLAALYFSYIINFS